MTLAEGGLPMNRVELSQRLVAEGIRADAYSLDGGDLSERLVLEDARRSWNVYYSERGQRTGERHFDSEEAACNYFLRTILASPEYRSDR